VSLTVACHGRGIRLPASLYVVGVIAVIVSAGLTALGVWQLQRRAWKLDLITRIEQRIGAAPVALPGPGSWSSVTASRDAYRHVRADGVLLEDQETLVQAVTALGGGFWLMTPFRTDKGFTVLVNRGFVPPDYKENKRDRDQASARLEITGLLRITEPHGGFLRANDPASNRWYSRDVEAISRARGLDDVAPYFIDADRSHDGGIPVAGLTVVDLPNNHLVYALTWFLLAGMTIFAAAHLVRSELVAAAGGDAAADRS
jgi:surfeit locus 1 family protein